MANPEHVEILKRGVEEWNEWRNEKRVIVPDLSGHRIEDANIGGRISLKINSMGTGFDYLKAIIPNFNNVNLRVAFLTHVRFSGANLTGANFNGAQLYGVDFVNPDLRYANFWSTFL